MIHLLDVYIVPESTCIFCPVMLCALSLRIKATVSATELIEVAFLSEVRLYILSFCSSVSVELMLVSMKPGTTILLLMPSSPHSLAVSFDKSSKDHFDEAYMARTL